MKYLSAKDLEEKFSVSRQTIYDWRKEQDFPRPYKIGGLDKMLWLESEVDKWAIDNRVAA